jgi:cbb3-type cytochrome oxidase subunit 3
MKSQVLSNFAWPELSILAFLIFLTFFCGMIYWTFRKGTRSLYKDVSTLPFDEGQASQGSRS